MTKFVECVDQISDEDFSLDKFSTNSMHKWAIKGTCH
jgi:hypothetical protein